MMEGGHHGKHKIHGWIQANYKHILTSLQSSALRSCDIQPQLYAKIVNFKHFDKTENIDSKSYRLIFFK